MVPPSTDRLYGRFEIDRGNDDNRPNRSEVCLYELVLLKDTSRTFVGFSSDNNTNTED